MQAPAGPCAVQVQNFGNSVTCSILSSPSPITMRSQSSHMLTLARSVAGKRISARTASTPVQHRCFASSTKVCEPCSNYLQATHLDSSASPTSSIAQTLHRFDDATLATYSRPSVLMSRGKGLSLWAKCDASENNGETERHYLDFTSGIAVNSLGHADEQIAKIAGEQAATLVHASNLYHNEWSGELAHRMVEMTRKFGGLGMQKGAGAKDQLKAFLANSGTEANEAALKFARKYAMVTSKKGPGEKSGLISFTNAFHGRSMGALSMTPAPKYQAPFAPLIGDTHLGTYNSFEDLNTLINEKTAGVIVEPIQGEGGINPASIEWLTALRKRCDEVGALLMYDEIQCGIFRTGTLWCHSEMPVEAHPDLVTMAKPLANGFPIGAVLMRKKVADAIQVGDHGTTFGGGPLASRIAHHVLERLSNDQLRTSMQESSKFVFERLTTIRNDFKDLITSTEDRPSPRGRGLLVGFSMTDPANAGKLVKIARERGLIILSAGSDSIRLAPSLNVKREEIEKAMDILESSLLVLRKEVS
ncbi:unnamed protein product [Sympodiomycopsis kandeliae]